MFFMKEYFSTDYVVHVIKPNAQIHPALAPWDSALTGMPRVIFLQWKGKGQWLITGSV